MTANPFPTVLRPSRHFLWIEVARNRRRLVRIADVESVDVIASEAFGGGLSSSAVVLKMRTGDPIRLLERAGIEPRSR
jgi:hypothetical protein